MTTFNNQRGITILFAVLLVSIVLTVSLSLFNITYRQIVLSTTARESRYAFYAADAALDCAFYVNFFSTENVFGQVVYDDLGQPSLTPANINTVRCLSDNVQVGDGAETDRYVRQFDLETTISIPKLIGQDTEPKTLCAKVIVSKEPTNFDASAYDEIRAYGYNVRCQDVDSGSARIVERLLLKRYTI